MSNATLHPAFCPPPNLSSIAAMLHDAAEALLRIGANREADEKSDSCDPPASRKPSGAHKLKSGAAECAPDAPDATDDDDGVEDAEGEEEDELEDEIRCYHLPHFVVRQERELLALHDETDFFHLPQMAYESLSTLVMLMRNIDDGVELSGFDLFLISEELSRPLRTLSLVCSHLGEYRPVKQTPLQ